MRDRPFGGLKETQNIIQIKTQTLIMQRWDSSNNNGDSSQNDAFSLVVLNLKLKTAGIDVVLGQLLEYGGFFRDFLKQK
jgi:hypothetical protein